MQACIAFTRPGRILVAMMRLQTDFNALPSDERAWLLLFEMRPLDDLTTIGLAEGDRVRLFQDEGDFDVEGVVGFGPVGPPALPEPRWFVAVDWSTLRDV